MWEQLNYTCLICGKRLTRGFYYCNKCAINFGMADKNGKFYCPSKWDDWARELYNMERRYKRMLKKEIFYNIEYSQEEDPSTSNEEADENEGFFNNDDDYDELVDL